jgi:hypothetical protein
VPEEVLGARRALFGFEALLAAHRTSERDLIAAYADSSAMLARTGAWTRTDLEEWRARVVHAESPADAARSDSILATLDQLYAVLLEQDGNYQLTPSGVHLSAPSTGDRYDDVRVTIKRLATGRGDVMEPPSPTLSLLLAFVGEATLPPRLSN